MTFNELTSKVAKKEGLKKEVSMGNVREVTRLVLTEIANMKYTEVAQLLKRYQHKFLR